jgi:hypothetical protein
MLRIVSWTEKNPTTSAGFEPPDHRSRFHWDCCQPLFPLPNLKFLSWTEPNLFLVSLGKGLRPRWEDNIKMDLQKVGRGREDWMELAQDRDRWRTLVGTVRNFRVP